MYFDMAKNPIKKIESDEAYENMSKGCYNLATEFVDLYLMTFPNSILKSTVALTTNVAFSCELYLKALIYKTKSTPRGHNLEVLFKKLPTEVQEEIKEKLPYGNIKKEEFELVLHEVSQAFEILRYIFERQGMTCNLQFLCELSLTLKGIYDDLIKN